MGVTGLRLLRLLSLLQIRPSWTGRELADRLGTTERTVRRDVTKVRDLGYVVQAAAGRHGGYHLAAGNGLPPLLLDDEEAIATVVALRVAATGALPGLEDALLAALAKLTQVVPVRLRRRIEALDVATVEVTTPRPAIDLDVLAVLAQGCRSSERLRVAYRGVERDIEPYRLTYQDARWYVLTRNPRRAEWRTLRVDHLTSATLTGHRFVLSEGPGKVKGGHRTTTARILIHASARRAAAYVPPAAGAIEPVNDTSCLLTISAEDPRWLTRFLLRLPFKTEVLEPPQLRRHIRSLGQRLVHTHS